MIIFTSGFLVKSSGVGVTGCSNPLFPATFFGSIFPKRYPKLVTVFLIG